MTFLVILFIKFYQNVLSGFMRQVLGIQSFCRYSPTCSNYAISVLRQYGILYGLFLTVKRILSCQPFVKFT